MILFELHLIQYNAPTKNIIVLQSKPDGLKALLAEHFLFEFGFQQHLLQTFCTSKVCTQQGQGQGLFAIHS